MDVALVEDAQHDIDDQNGDDQQHQKIAQRVLERLGCSLEGGADGRRQSFRRDLLNLRGYIAQRRARLQIERNRDRGELAKVADGLRSDVFLNVSERIERDQCTIARFEVK